MRAVEYLKQVGIDTLLKECNYSLKIVKANIMRECNITDNDKVRYAMTLVKKRLKQITKADNMHSSIKSIIIRKLKGKFANG